MRLTLQEAREVIRKQELWVWRQENWKNDADYELELTGYQAVGAAGSYFDIPNR